MAVAVLAWAQEPPKLTSTVHLVVAPATVTDRGGHYVDGLGEKDFLLRDNGEHRDVNVDVSYFPISLVVAVQSSSFCAAALNKIHHVGSLFEPLVTGEQGEVAVVSFDQEVRLALPFSSDSTRLSATLAGIQPGEEASRMVDAIARSVELLAARPARNRKVILLIGEAKDRSSKTKLADVVSAAERENVSIYPVTYSPYTTAFTATAGTVPPPSWAGINLIAIQREIVRLAKRNTADAFASMTGGRRFSFTRQRGLEDAIGRLGEELHSQYLLSFTVNPESETRYHAIEVEVAGRPELAVRTRPGYWMSQ